MQLTQEIVKSLLIYDDKTGYRCTAANIAPRSLLTGESRRLGSYADPEQAFKVYKKAIKQAGFHALHGDEKECK